MTQKQVETQVDTIVGLRKEVTDLKNKLAESSKQSKNAFRLFLFTWAQSGLPETEIKSRHFGICFIKSATASGSLRKPC
tara:strand:+ start:257 stop:493 length:237 start_codon:yes stop_codon:yes gene_type:complete